MTPPVNQCPSCLAVREHRVFYEQPHVPVHSCLLIDNRDEAVSFPRGDIRLSICEQCGFIWNSAFDPALMNYAGEYEETQNYSATFRRFQSRLIKKLVQRHQLYGKRILEIGCGKGEFLVELCCEGNNVGIGFDPGFQQDRIDAGAHGSVQFVKDYFSESYAGIQTDFACCRQTLEHIARPNEFLRCIRDAITSEDYVIHFQLPDTRRVLQEAAFWDVYYEHCSYFCPESLESLFRSVGFEVTNVSIEYDNQYLLLDALPARNAGKLLHESSDFATELGSLAERFAEQVESFRKHWRLRIDRFVANRQRVAVWGSGSKAVAFLNCINVGDAVKDVVDINPRKHGKYLPGTGHEIIGPESLVKLPPDIVIAMNPIYLEEIQAELDRRQVKATVISINEDIGPPGGQETCHIHAS